MALRSASRFTDFDVVISERRPPHNVECARVLIGSCCGRNEIRNDKMN